MNGWVFDHYEGQADGSLVGLERRMSGAGVVGSSPGEIPQEGLVRDQGAPPCFMAALLFWLEAWQVWFEVQEQLLSAVADWWEVKWQT